MWQATVLIITNINVATKGLGINYICNVYIILYCETFCFQARLIDIHDVKPLYESKIFKSNNYVYDAHRKMIVQTVPAAATPENQNGTDSDMYACKTEDSSRTKKDMLKNHKKNMII